MDANYLFLTLYSDSLLDILLSFKILISSGAAVEGAHPDGLCEEVYQGVLHTQRQQVLRAEEFVVMVFDQ